LASFAATLCFGDVVEMVNGDLYSGSVLSVTLTNVSVRSEIQGANTLPRAKVARIIFTGPAAAASTNGALAASASAHGRVPAPLELTRKLQPKGADTNFIARVQNELLEQAGPEAARKYHELARGLLSGSLSLGDLRRQAQQTIQDAEALKQDLGPETSEALDAYLQILRAFVNESAMPF
jgi:hypothetical protein